MTENEELQKELDSIEVVDFEVVEANESATVESPLTDEEALAQMPVNIPYKKIFNDEGDLVNPITKENPYRMPFMNRRQKNALIRKATRHPKNNKKGIRLVVTPFAKGQFTKTEIVKQVINENTVPIVDLVEGDFVLQGYKTHEARTIIHNKTQL